MRAQLARSLGLDKYAEIMRGDPASPSFQRAFNGYYRIRRNEEWRNSYYALFLRARTEGFDFSQIITALFQATGNVEASFSSKMLATIPRSISKSTTTSSFSRMKMEQSFSVKNG